MRDPRRTAAPLAAALPPPLHGELPVRPAPHGAKAAAMPHIGKRFLGRGAYGLDYGA